MNDTSDFEGDDKTKWPRIPKRISFHESPTFKPSRSKVRTSLGISRRSVSTPKQSGRRSLTATPKLTDKSSFKFNASDAKDSSMDLSFYRELGKEVAREPVETSTVGSDSFVEMNSFGVVEAAEKTSGAVGGVSFGDIWSDTDPSMHKLMISTYEDGSKGNFERKGEESDEVLSQAAEEIALKDQINSEAQKEAENQKKTVENVTQLQEAYQRSIDEKIAKFVNHIYVNEISTEKLDLLRNVSRKIRYILDQEPPTQILFPYCAHEVFQLIIQYLKTGKTSLLRVRNSCNLISMKYFGKEFGLKQMVRDCSEVYNYLMVRREAELRNRYLEIQKAHDKFLAEMEWRQHRVDMEMQKSENSFYNI